MARRGRLGFLSRLITSQNPLTVQVGFAARHVAGIVAVAVELKDQQRRARGLTREVLDVGVRPALEVRDVDDVHVRPRGDQARRRQDLLPGASTCSSADPPTSPGPSPGSRSGSRWRRSGGAASADVAVDVAIVDLVAAADQHDAGLPGLSQSFERVAARCDQPF